MRILTWNINGLRAILGKNFTRDIRELNPDVICLQEIKAKEIQLAEIEILPEFQCKYFNSAERLGYSGTAIFSKADIALRNGPTPDRLISPEEGRVQVADCGFFFLVNVYTPNVGAELSRLNFRYKTWDSEFFMFLEELHREKPVIVCGDLNVAHQEIDLSHPDRNRGSAGFTDEEREGFSRYIALGWVDVFRQFYPQKSGCYTWWSYRMSARQRNIGWRIDYFLASQEIAQNIKHIEICASVTGSDHAPLFIDI